MFVLESSPMRNGERITGQIKNKTINSVRYMITIQVHFSPFKSNPIHPAPVKATYITKLSVL